jgi:galactokinase/mevalonate kinase-like predicted kinase
MEFAGEQTIVNPLRIRPATLTELEAMLVLYSTGISRESAKIITEQSASLRSGHEAPLEAMHQIKRDAYAMKRALLYNDLRAFAATLGRSWEAKKRTASGISNGEIERIHALAMEAGAWSGKVSVPVAAGSCFSWWRRSGGRICCACWVGSLARRGCAGSPSRGRWRGGYSAPSRPSMTT